MNKNYIENQIDTAKQMIENRLNRLRQQKEMLQGSPQAEFGRLMGNRQIYMNPGLYSYQFHEPIYYPLENPISGEPITLPKIELGQPIGTEESEAEQGLSLSEILNLLSQMNTGGNNNVPIAMPYKPKKNTKKKKKKLSPLKKKTV